MFLVTQNENYIILRLITKKYSFKTHTTFERIIGHTDGDSKKLNYLYSAYHKYTPRKNIKELKFYIPVNNIDITDDSGFLGFINFVFLCNGVRNFNVGEIFINSFIIIWFNFMKGKVNLGDFTQQNLSKLPEEKEYRKDLVKKYQKNYQRWKTEILPRIKENFPSMTV